MLRPRRLLPAVLLAPAGVLLATPAAALTPTSIGDIVQGLRGDQVFVHPDFAVPVDEDELSGELDGSQVALYVVAVPQELASSQQEAARLVDEVGSTIGNSDAVVLVINDQGQYFTDEGNAAEGRGVDAVAAAQSALSGGVPDAASLTTSVGVMSDRLDQQLSAGGGAGDGAGAPAGLLPLVLIGALGVGAYSLTRRRKTAKAGRQTLEDLRADVESLYGRLGSDVELLAPGDDAVAR